MKVSVLIERLKQLRYEQFQADKLTLPMGSIPEDAEVVVEYWDKDGFHGLVKDFDVNVNINNNIEISPNA